MEVLDVPKILASGAAKIDRAAEHCEELRALLDELDASYRIEPVYDDARGWLVFKVVEVEPPPASVSLIAGDVLQNLNSALDHIAWNLVLADGLRRPDEPFAPDRGTYWPARLVPPVPTTMLVRPKLVDPGIIAALEALQPYSDVMGYDREPQSHPLYLVRELAKIDRHRQLLTTYHALALDSIWWPSGDGRPTPKKVGGMAFNRGPIREGYEVAAFVFDGDHDPDFNPHLRLEVRLNLDGAELAPYAEGARVDRVLDHLCRQTRFMAIDYLGQALAHAAGS